MLTPFLNKRLREKFSYLGVEEIDVALREFERFATLALHSPGVFLPCSPLVDSIWHEAILETRDYKEFCHNIKPGSYLHHSGIELGDYMIGRTCDEQDSQALSVLTSYVANFGPFSIEAVKYWIVAREIMTQNGWAIDELNTFLLSLIPDASEANVPVTGMALEDLMQKFHKDAAGTTEAYFSRIKTSLGECNTYEALIAECVNDGTPSNSRVVDIGCGIGTLYKLLSTRTPQVKYFGIDNSPDEISIGRQSIRSTDATMICADAYDMPLRDSYFDLAVSHMTMHLLGDADRIFREISRVLRTGGKFYFTIPARKNETPGEIAYSDVVGLFDRFGAGGLASQTKSVFQDQSTTLEAMKFHFSSSVNVVKEYTLQLDPRDPFLVDHFTGLYPYAKLNQVDRAKYKDLALLAFDAFAKDNPGAPLERRMVIYTATKG